MPRRHRRRQGKEQKGVYVIENNKVKFFEVMTGITGEADIEIVSGLQDRDGNSQGTKSSAEDFEGWHEHQDGNRSNAGVRQRKREAANERRYLRAYSTPRLSSKTARPHSSTATAGGDDFDAGHLEDLLDGL